MKNRFERDFIFSGLALLALLPFGVLGIVNPLVQWPIFIVHLGLLLQANLSALKRVRGLKAHPLAIAVVCLVMLVSVVLCSVPVTARDALIHHLAVPQWWLADGKVQTYGWYDFSYYPMLIQLAFVPLLQAFPPQSCALYHLLYLIPFAASAARLAELLYRRSVHEQSSVHHAHALANVSLLGFLCALTLPLAIRTGTEPLVDLPLAAFCGVATVLLLEEQLLAGVALGLALSTKYNALPFALFLCLAAPLAKVSLRAVVKIAVIAFLVAAPWGARNYLETGNPLFPLGRPSASLGSISSRTLLYGETWLDLVSTPVMMLIDGADDDPRRFDGVLSPLLLLAAFALWKYRRNRTVWAVTILSAAYFITAQFSSGARVRYLLPILPHWCALTALALSAFSRPALVAILVGHAAWVGSYIVGRTTKIGLIPFITTPQSTSQYLQSRLPEYAFSQRIGSLIPRGEQVYLVLTGSRFFYLPFRAQSAGYISGPELQRWAVAGSIEQELRRRNCNFLLVNARLFEKLSDNDAPSLIALVRDQLTPVDQEGDFILLRVHEGIQ